MFEKYKIGKEAMKFFQLAYQFQLKGKFEDAVFYYRKSLDVEATAEGHTFLGWAYSFLGKLDDAIEECLLAIEIDPEFGNAYNDIGSYLMHLDRLDEAIYWLEKAKKATRYENPEYAFVNLARAYEHKGLWPLAIREYEGALKIKPDYSPAQMSLEALQAMMN